MWRRTGNIPMNPSFIRSRRFVSNPCARNLADQSKPLDVLSRTIEANNSSLPFHQTRGHHRVGAASSSSSVYSYSTLHNIETKNKSPEAIKLPVVARKTPRQVEHWMKHDLVRLLRHQAARAVTSNENENDFAATKPNMIRNFSIIAHIDHGKSSLADSLLEYCGNISPNTRESAGSNLQMDTLQVEQERGITVKAQNCSMVYDDRYLLNFVDTPGHVDFSFEVSRALTACEGVLLLVDSTQGIQAQTLSTYRIAKERGLTILPVLTKIDRHSAQIDDVMLDLAVLLDIDPETVVCTSAKANLGIDTLLEKIVQDIPGPRALALNSKHTKLSEEPEEKKLRCLVIDSIYDEYRGVICYVRVVHGTLRPTDRVQSFATKTSYDIQEVGVLLPQRVSTSELTAGQVGYVIMGMKNITEATLGDTMYFQHEASSSSSSSLEPLERIKMPVQMVFASFYPTDDGSFDQLRVAIERLRLNDASVTVFPETSTALGMGFRCGFLGVLHMDVFRQRLADEQQMNVLITAPMVPYQIRMIPDEATVVQVETPGDFPDINTRHHHVFEPMVEATLMFPQDYLGSVLALIKNKRGRQQDLQYLEEGGRLLFICSIPWQEMVTEFYDEFKSITSGFGTVDFHPIENELADIVKVNILVNGDVIDALSFITHRDKAYAQGRKICQKLKSTIDRQQFEIIVQASLGTKVFAKERLAPYRKDVLIKSGKTVGGGDHSRKQKLLSKQKEGKKRMKTVGNLQLSQEAFSSVLSR